MCFYLSYSESSDEEADDEDGTFKMGIHGMGCGQDESSQALSYFALALTIEEGVVSMFPEVGVVYVVGVGSEFLLIVVHVYNFNANCTKQIVRSEQEMEQRVVDVYFFQKCEREER